jgi:hypothetical protein
MAPSPNDFIIGLRAGAFRHNETRTHSQVTRSASQLGHVAQVRNQDGSEWIGQRSGPVAEPFCDQADGRVWNGIGVRHAQDGGVIQLPVRIANGVLDKPYFEAIGKGVDHGL